MAATTTAGRQSAGAAKSKPATKAATKAAKAAKATAKAVTLPRNYVVVLEPDNDGVVWYYPARGVGAPASGGGSGNRSGSAGEACPVVYFMAPVGTPGRAGRGRPQRAQRTTRIRFRSLVRAVRFASDDAAAERELLGEMKRLMAM